MAKKEVDGVTVEASSILTALKIIKTVCEDNIDCKKCPMWAKKDNLCLIGKSIPSAWNINVSDKPWRALLP